MRSAVHSKQRRNIGELCYYLNRTFFAMAPCLPHLSLHLPLLLSSFLVTHLIIFLGRLEYPGCYHTGPEHVEGSQGRQEKEKPEPVGEEREGLAARCQDDHVLHVVGQSPFHVQVCAGADYCSI